MYIHRHMEPLVMRLNQQYPVILITGPRQAGKTTMLEHLTETEGRGRTKVSLDDVTERELAKTDPRMFFQIHRPPLLIDEVQYAPELFPYIKYSRSWPTPAIRLGTSGSPAPSFLI